MRPVTVIAGTAALVAAFVPAVHARAIDAPVQKAPASATRQGAIVRLAGDRIARTWRVTTGPLGSLVTTQFVDTGTGRNWAGPSSPDFALTFDGVPLTSAQPVWSVSTMLSPPDADPATVTFRLVSPLVEVDRTYTLFAGASVIGVRATVVNRTSLVARIGKYSLDELTGPAGHANHDEVQTYHGGSDWRDDYRVVSHPAGSFDTEGEVVRVDDGTGSGVFLVTERRSGAMSRVARDATNARVWAGVDNARDLLDAGPLLTDPPNYNRVANPLYPLPIRQRTLLPLASLELGRAHTGVYHGGAAEAAANFTSDFAAHTIPAFARTVGLNSFHPWSHSTAFNGTTMLAQAQAGLPLGLETVMLDDQWQGGPGGESGDWRFDPVRFPDHDHDGVPDFVTQLHALGLKLGLWMSPVEFNMASTTYKAHPTWACAPTGDITAQIQDDAGLGVWDVTKPAFRDYLTGVIDRLVARYDVREFKFDFQAWVDCLPHDYLDYEDAFVSLVRRFEARHPGVTFELDETNDQRAWPFESAALGPSWFDNGHLHGSGPVAKLLHDLWTAAPWLPPSTIGVGAFDGTLTAPYTAEFLAPIALLSHFTFWTDVTKITPADANEIAWWTAWYRDHRADLAGAVYELTANDPLNGTGWTVFEPWAGDHGELFAFRQAGGSDTITVAARGVDPNRDYRLTDVRTNTDLGVLSGAALRAGFPLALAPFVAEVITITQV